MPAAAAAACLPLVPLVPPCYTTVSSASRKLFHNDDLNYKPPMVNRGRRRLPACYSTTSSSSNNNTTSSNITEFDLYELMGIDSSCDRSQIKTAYRTLQKQCHPDIAGAAGHDMAIILNEAYALLSDPNSRAAYDKEQAKIAELRGYSGKPIYSVWFGSESEERAVFVDEVKCVGCLKCALLAEKTFAIESVYGRARVVGQWADPEPKIQEAIEACPVDCISVVERSNLAALEFLMSKQPRSSVRIGVGNTAGTRVSNIFVDVKKFQTRVQDAKHKASSTQTNSNETELQREARLSAIQAIRSISNWLYWKTPNSHQSTTSRQTLTQIGGQKSNSKGPNIDKLRDAAAARKQARYNHQSTRRPVHLVDDQDYWTPLTNALPAEAPATSSSSIQNNYSNSSSVRSSSSASSDQQSNQTDVDKHKLKNDDSIKYQRNTSNPIRLLAPLGPAILMATVVGRFNLQGADDVAVGGLKEHIYGSLALEIVNSSWLQIILAAITWYIIGMLILGLADAIKSRNTY